MSRSLWNNPVPRALRTGSSGMRLPAASIRLTKLEKELSVCERRIRYALTVNGMNRIVEETQKMNALRKEISNLRG